MDTAEETPSPWWTRTRFSKSREATKTDTFALGGSMANGRKKIRKCDSLGRLAVGIAVAKHRHGRPKRLAALANSQILFVVGKVLPSWK